MTESSCCADGAKNTKNAETSCCGSKEKSGCGCNCGCNSKMTTYGKTERLIRAVIGMGLIALVFVGPQTPWGWIGIVPLVSALTGWCPIYMLTECGKKTCCSENSTNKPATCCSGESGKTCCS